MVVIYASAVPSHKATTSETKKQTSNSNFDRRILLATFLGAAAQASTPAPSKAADLTPYQQGFRLEYGLQPDGRVRKCNAAAQPNCISTSSFSDLYSPPWLAGPSDPAAAMDEFENAFKSLNPEVQLLERQELPSKGVYCRWKVADPVFEYDIVEVLIAPQQPPYDNEPPLVTFRSQAGTVKYVWPITQPVSDLGAQKNRMSELRRRLQWRIMGGDCDVLECFKE